MLAEWPDEMRLEIASPERRMRFLAAFDARLNAAKRDALVLYAQICKMIGQERDLAVLIVGQVGAPVPDARRAVDMMQRVRDATPDDIGRAAFAELDRLAGERGMSFDQLRESLTVHTNGVTHE